MGPRKDKDQIKERKALGRYRKKGGIKIQIRIRREGVRSGRKDRKKKIRDRKNK